jgi:hypothetical protein
MTTIKMTIGTYNVTYVAKRTTAPRNYDGFGTLEIYDSGDPRLAKTGVRHDETGEVRSERLVLVDVEHEEWQTSRYFSGLYSCETADGLEDYVQRSLLERVRKNDDE